jgi:hypothetical protein
MSDVESRIRAGLGAIDPLPRGSKGDWRDVLGRVDRPKHRRRWALALGGVAAVAAVLIAVLVLLPTGSGGPSPAAAAALDRLARLVAAQPLTPQPGQYLYVGSEAENAAYMESRIGACETLVPQRRQIWIGTDGSGLIRETSGPGHWVNRATCLRIERKYGPKSEVRFELSRHSGDQWFAPQCLSLKPSNRVDWSTLSSDPQVLLQQMRQLDGGPPTPGEDFQHIGDFLRETDAPPAVRATLLRAAALIPGVKLLGTVRDHDGRLGTGFSYPSQGPYVTKGSSSELIFDQQTGELLGEQGTGPKNWTVYLQDKVVDALPSKPPVPLKPPCDKRGAGVSHPVPGGSLTNGAPLKSP